MKVLICGGGVIGVSIAYFLSLRGIEAVVVERTGVANAASGKSGGFLARDWCDGTPVAALARRGFDLHAELAASLGGRGGRDWGYRRVEALGVVAGEGRDMSRFARLPSPDWLGADSAVHGRLSTAETTAQIHPAAFTAALMAAAIERGARLIEGCVQGIMLAPDGKRATGALVDDTELAADAVVIAMGPWSLLACRWLPLPAVYGVKAHSLVFDFEPSAESLFADVETGSGEAGASRILSAAGRHHLCLRFVRRQSVTGRSGRRRARTRRQRAAAAPDRLRVARSGGVEGAGGAGLLPAGDGRRAAPDRPGAGRRRRMGGHGPQRLGHAQRPLDRRGDGGTDRGRRGHDGRSAAVRSCPAETARSGSFPFLIDTTRERRPGQSGRGMVQTSSTVM